MSANNPLTGIVLIDCAKSNAKSGIGVAAAQCGYGEDLAAFQAALQHACDETGIAFKDLSSLVTEQQEMRTAPGFEVAPDTQSQL